MMNRTNEALESLRHSFRLDPQKRREFEEEFSGVRSMHEFRSLLQGSMRRRTRVWRAGGKTPRGQKVGGRW